MNILIIDDEPIIANTVFTQLSEMNEDNDRFDIAYSAEEARAFLKYRVYEILLCDIVMPKEDGIHFAKWVLQEHPDSKVIFLTAHADFEYMKEAISLQSFDYILQPAEKTELKNVVGRAKSQIAIEKKNKELLSTGAFFQDKEMDILDVNVMRYLRYSTDNADYLKRLFEMHIGSSEKETEYLLFSVQVLKSGYLWKEEEHSFLRGVYYNILQEIMGSLSEKIVLNLQNDAVGSFIVFILFRESNKPELAIIMNKLENLRYMFEKLLKMDVAIYCGDYCLYGELREMYQKILQAQANNVQDSSRVIHAGELKGNQSSGYSFDLYLTSWQAFLNQNRIIDFKNSVMNYLHHQSVGNKINQDFMMRFHQEISELFFPYMSANNVKSSEVFDENLSYYDFMYCYHHISDFNNAFNYIIQKLCERVETVDENMIQGIIRYIHQNIDVDLSVNSIADLVGLNHEYLSRIFKRSTGFSLKRYITNEKIKAAKILLETTDLSVTIIAGRVGYANYSNFTRSFRQIAGCTPSEYRKR